MILSALVTAVVVALEAVRANPAAFYTASGGSLGDGLGLEKRQTTQVIRSCTKPNTAALTFDDGPWVYLYDVSAALVAANATGTFFFNGNNYECIYNTDQIERVKYAVSQGHQIASHTWGHKDLTKLTWDEIHDEMWRVEDALQRMVGLVPAFIRPPYGAYNDLVLEAATVRNKTLVNWDVDTGDTLNMTVGARKLIYDTTISRHPENMLVLNHEVVDSTVHEVLPYAIAALQKAGYKLVTVAECLGMPAYQGIQEPQIPNATWHC